jgi:hypothetical protein
VERKAGSAKQAKAGHTFAALHFIRAALHRPVGYGAVNQHTGSAKQ